jgi:hypothetical protein
VRILHFEAGRQKGDVVCPTSCGVSQSLDKDGGCRVAARSEERSFGSGGGSGWVEKGLSREVRLFCRQRQTGNVMQGLTCTSP